MAIKIQAHCKRCGKEFTKVRSAPTKYCSKECGWESLKKEKVIGICLYCEKKYVKKYHLDSKFCSRKCFGEYEKGKNNPSWKCGRTNNNKYVLVMVPGHPSGDKNSYVLEHRLVIEKSLGRYLTSEEVVHHINGDPQDNRIENLMLFPNNSEHLKHHALIRKQQKLNNLSINYIRESESGKE